MSIAIVTQTSNKRAAHCGFCGTRLHTGQGHRVERDYSSPLYLCRACHSHRQQLSEMEPELKRALAEIKDWCSENVNLRMGWNAASHVEAMIRKCDLQAAEVAAEIVARLVYVTDFSYGAVVTLAKEVIWEFENESGECTCRPDSDLACPSCSRYINDKAIIELPY